MYKKIFVPLMLIDNNVYTFISGILVSLATNIFTSLCFEKIGFYTNGFMYIASLAFLISSALCMYISVKLSTFQNYIIEKRISDYEAKKIIVLDATKAIHLKWVIIYIITMFFSICGVLFLVFDFVVKN